ncbi:translational regulator orb2-like [Armigeres subalbatus]|uniref:translational regulator orb2-like n=1 Tax=Armigeres subalbatus TaxID=124917 RepID=UPI002ED46A94
MNSNIDKVSHIIEYLQAFRIHDLKCKPFFSGLDEHISDEAGGFIGGGGGNNSGNNHPHSHQHHQHHHHHHQLTALGGSPARSSPHSNGSESTERFSRKVFVGGLPPDIDEGHHAERYDIFAQLISASAVDAFVEPLND